MYLLAADFREQTQKPWCKGLLLTEGDCSNAELDLLIAQVAGQWELELDDDFDPPSPDNDETINVEGTLGPRLHIPRRVRSLTMASTRSLSGMLTAVSSASYRLRSSLNSTGTAMVGTWDWLDSASYNTWAADGGVQLVGKFGWAAVPNDIKRLVALRVYDVMKATADPLSTVTQRITSDGQITMADSREITRIRGIYQRSMPVMA